MRGDRPVSALLLARDETRDLGELIPTLAFAREVVVVWDPRGDPATRAAAERLGARVFERAFDGFGAQRQFALERCTQEWVLWIDADERLAPGALERLEREVLAPGAPAAGCWGVALRRTGYFLGRRIRFCGWRDERVLRLFRRDSARFDDALVHERVHFAPASAAGDGGGSGAVRAGTIVRSTATLEHHSYRTRADCEVKLVRYAEANAEKSLRAGRRANGFDVALRPPLRFLRQYVLQLGLLDGVAGFQLCVNAARQVRLKYALIRAGSRVPAAR